MADSLTSNSFVSIPIIRENTPPGRQLLFIPPRANKRLKKANYKVHVKKKKEAAHNQLKNK